MQLIALALSRALLSAGRSIAARMAMIAIAINNSISVNDFLFLMKTSVIELLYIIS